MSQNFGAGIDSGRRPIGEETQRHGGPWTEDSHSGHEALDPSDDRDADRGSHRNLAADIDDSHWEVFLADDDELDPLPDRSDFWIEPTTDSLDD